MILRKRRSGAQRGWHAVKLEVYNFNTAGQGGDNTVVLYDTGADIYYSFEIESEAELRELQSAVAKAGLHV